MNGLTLEREIREFLRDTYGATNIDVIPGGKHPKIVFDYAGKHWSRGFACSPSDENAAKAACRDLARMLGAPPVQTGKARRTLDEMTHSLDARAPLLPLAAPPLRRLGRLSLRPASSSKGVRLLAYVTEDSLERAKLVGAHLKIDYTSDGPVLRRAVSGPVFRTNGTATLLEAAFQDAAFPLISPRLFRSSPIEVVAMDDQLGIIVDPAKLNYDQEKEKPVMTRASKTFNRGSFDDLDAIRINLGMSESEFSVALGYSVGAFSGFRADGSAPAVALLAAEALEHRHQDAQPRPEESVKVQPDRHYMIQITAAGQWVSTTEVPADLDSMTLSGKRYYLLPAE